MKVKYPGKGASKAAWRKYFVSIQSKRASSRSDRRKNPSMKRTLRKLRYIITAKGHGKHSPKMHYDGKKFSQRIEIKTYPTRDIAYKKALSLVNVFPVLRKYIVAVEPYNF